jgi:hypothetical protein
VTYQTYEEERASDQRFEEQQERLAQEAEELEERVGRGRESDAPLSVPPTLDPGEA